MTISQSRYGMASEVGRNPNRPARKESKQASAVLGSLGVTAGGAGVYGYGRYMPRGAQARYKIAVDGSRQVSQDYLAARDFRRTIEGNIARRPGGPTPNQMKNLVAGKAEELTQQKRLRAAGAARREAKSALTTAVRRGKFVRQGGAAVIGAGLLSAGISAAAGERARHTSGYRRPTREEVRARIASQQNVGRVNVDAARVEGDRYRAMGR